MERFHCIYSNALPSPFLLLSLFLPYHNFQTPLYISSDLSYKHATEGPSDVQNILFLFQTRTDQMHTMGFWRYQVIFKLLHYCFIGDAAFEMCNFTVKILWLE